MSEHPSESIILEAATATSIGSCVVFSILGIAILFLNAKSREEWAGDGDEGVCYAMSCVLGVPLVLLGAAIIGASFGLVIGLIKTWSAIWTCLAVIGFILLGLVLLLGCFIKNCLDSDSYYY
jgi:uncharacterized membrane protein